MATITDMQVHVCQKCGCESWMLASFLEDKRRTQDTFYCPNGHPRAFVKSTAELLQEKLDLANTSLAEKTDKLEKIKTGKCPFCGKIVRNLSGHIERCHA